MTEENKILVVDDEAVVRDLISDVLTSEGYTVESAPSGPTALELLKAGDNYVLLFTDIMMPEMDGIALIREARNVSPNLIPIVMTGFATLETARAAVKEGAYDYVLKPFSLSEIKLAVTNAFERFRLTHENARLREITELFNISETIANIRDEKSLLDFILRAALERVSAERGSLMVLTRDGKALEIAASVGLPNEAVKSSTDVDKSIAGLVVHKAQPLLVKDIRDVPELEGISRRLKEPSFISVPLERKQKPDGAVGHTDFSEGRVLAVLNVTGKRGGRHFTEGDLKILSIVANHAAAAMENARLIHHVEDAHLSTIQSMAMLLEAKDAYTHGHSERVRDYCAMAAVRMGMSEREVETLRLGAMLHDIGKVGVKDAVLNKTTRLTPEEWESIKRHPVIGYDVLKPVNLLRKEHLELVRSHHERIDGKGYPDGRSGDELSDFVRVIGVADAYDAMSSTRAYRNLMSPEEIIAELKRCSETQFCSKVAKLFIEMIKCGEIVRKQECAV
jgi:response regulator RpfG family c-di-GMP phosphodiesterase